jgi:hypothetical protein
MRTQIAPPSYLPSMLLPCPSCGGRITIKSAEPDAIDKDLQNITHQCAHCSTQLIRTIIRWSGLSEGAESAA